MSQSEPTPKPMLWTGRIMSGLPAAMLLLDAAMKFVKPEPVVKGTLERLRALLPLRS